MTTAPVKWQDTDGALDKLVLKAETLTIKDAATYKGAQVELMGLKNLKSEVQSFYKPQKKAIDEAKDKVLAEERKRLRPIDEAIGIYGEKITEWDTEQRALARAAEEAAAAEAKKTGQMVPAKPVQNATVEGFGFQTVYKAVVVDKLEVIRAVLKGLASADVLEVVLPVANDWARTAGPQTKAAETPGEVIPMPGVPGLGITAERRPRGR